MRRRIHALLVAAAAIALTLPLAPASAAPAEPSVVDPSPTDVYTTPGEHTINGRKWRTECEAYSSVVERCQTEIWATVTSWDGTRFSNNTDWAFNNLTYKPVPYRVWEGNPLAQPGIHTISGRQWRVECSNEWTGPRACRALILATVPEHHGSTYRMATKWVFNNIIRFTDYAPQTPDLDPTTSDTVITPTTSAEIAGTWRAGCPVGASGLSTIRTNLVGMDGRVHRGEIIVRKDLAPEVADVLERSFRAGFPIERMENPNNWGGDDIAMMAANNSSAFNCRHVVGNPSRQSPHSYGYAVDINPVQNPYKDPSGRWYPSSQYVQRTPVVPGMLTTTSEPVVAFKSYGWEWFNGWDWHHFERRAVRTTPISPTSLTNDGPQSVDPATKSVDLFALGCVAQPDVTPPISATEHVLSDGVEVSLAFATAEQAGAWFTQWRAANRDCSDVTAFSDGPDGWSAYRDLHDGPWAESVTLEGTSIQVSMTRSA